MDNFSRATISYAEAKATSLSLIKRFEGFSSCPYTCSAGKLTIGYGHVILSGENLTEVTESEAEDLLKKDLKLAEDLVDSVVFVPLTANQWAAMVSLAFNIGRGNFSSSTLLKLLNDGQYLEVPLELMKWRRAGGKIVKGLILRRLKEAELFLT